MARANFLNQKRFLALDLTYGYPIRVMMYEYLLENGMTKEEYQWFQHNQVSARCIMGNDYYETISEISDAREHGLPNLGIGHRCYIKNALVDKNCRIGDDVRINGGSHLENTDHSLYTVKDGIVVIKKGAILPNGFVI